MTYQVDINCDMGESYGKFVKGRDEEVMPYITTANIAAGFHAGDPHIMRKTVLLAKEHGVNVGVHPGLPDVLGFGRRKMDTNYLQRYQRDVRIPIPWTRRRADKGMGPSPHRPIIDSSS